MNRLWIRLSFTFGLVLLLASFLPPLVFLSLWLLGYVQVPVPPEIDSASAATIQSELILRALRQIGAATVLSAILGTIAGALASRSLVAPLNRLAAGAAQIGRRNLSYRVPLEGRTDEVAAVARAFNAMATDLEQAESLRQNLLADVAHELRTPLTVIQGNLRAILDDVYPLDKEEVARLYEQTRQLTHLVADLHELAQAEANALVLERGPVEVPQLVTDAVADFRPLAEDQGVTLRQELLGKLPPVTADRPRLVQIIYNLLGNALQHTPAGGQVTLQAEAAGGQLAIRVIDDGEGIGAEHLPHVFDRFYRTDRSRTRADGREGSGLGLAIARAIARAHGGDVLVESQGKKHGSTFTLILPL